MDCVEAVWTFRGDEKRVSCVRKMVRLTVKTEVLQNCREASGDVPIWRVLGVKYGSENFQK